ncbi:MAG: UDP-N-acetylmuramoyl-L-alanine--D-glutamate ligase [Oscillospiraceae bacterium]|nr:UDP-N-acetylmuramoyl-L-alanine--D-glutamate ligase [Oscillospiraceae bacterium]
MDKYVLVAGSGISGIGASKLLLKRGKKVIVYDKNINLDKNDIISKINMNDIRKDNFEVLLGEITKEVIDKIDFCVISPGISLEEVFVKALKEANIPIWSEIELAYKYGNGKIAAITGTNGKTTTTALTGQILSKYCGKENTFIVGNIGMPYTDEASYMNENSVVALEVSSFQLETIINFHPTVSAILNITPDHLDRHQTMENYIKIKESIIKNQNSNDTVVLNYEDIVLRNFGQSNIKPKVIFFSSKTELTDGLYLEDETIFWNKNNEKLIIGKTSDFNLVGQCNYENIMAAVAITYSMGVPLEIIKNEICKFTAVEHRIEYTATKNGVTYYNDSKATNPDAAIQGIKAMKNPTILIGGGYDKGSEYDEWIKYFKNKVKLLILLGQTKDKIADCAKKYGFNNIVFVESIEEAVSIAEQNAVKGDSVLLSPACASWDMFKSYEERGKIFKKLVNKLDK